jgi:hypothetical protein
VVAPVTDPGPDTQVATRVVDLARKLRRGTPNRERIQAAGELAKLEERGKPASRDLCQALADELRAGAAGRREVKLALAEALEKVNPPLHRSVITLVVDDSVLNRSRALQQIHDMEAEGKPAVPLILYVRDREHGGAFLVETLAAVAPDEKRVTDLFAAWLQRDRDAATRAACAAALARVEGGKAKAAALVFALRDQVEAVQVAAATALGDLGVDTPAVLQALALAKTDHSERVREAAQAALEKIKAGR